MASLSRKQKAWPCSCVLSGVANTVKQAQPEACTNKKDFTYNFQIYVLTPPQLSRTHSRRYPFLTASGAATPKAQFPRQHLKLSNVSLSLLPAAARHRFTQQSYTFS